MSFKALNLASDSDLKEWLNVWEESPGREPMTHPAYLKAFKSPDEQAFCCMYEDSRGKVMMPVFVRSLAPLDWTQGADYSDITTPYGYGGPSKIGNPDPEAFWNEFTRWSQQMRAASFVARLSLFPEDLVPFQGEVQEVMMNVVRSLDLPEEQMLMDYEHKVRKNLKKADRNGLTVEIDPSGAHLNDFLRIYEQTMARNNASESFLFKPEFFETLTKEMPECCMFFHTLMEGKIISTELVLVGANNIYSFLGGTDEAYYEFRPNDILKHAVIQWGHKEGKKNFVMGGGYGREDGIYKYKLSFAPEGARPFSIGKKITDPSVYNELCRLRAEAEGPGWVPDPSYFPAYRAKALSPETAPV